MNDSDKLAHSGIKGMKWGVRRYQNPDGSLTEEGKARYGKPSADENEKSETEKWSSKDSKKLSDDELRTRVNRLMQESQYKRLLKELNTPEIKQKKEHPLFKQIFIASATTAMASVVTTLATNTIQNKIAKAICSDPTRLAEFMKNKAMREKIFPKKK